MKKIPLKSLEISKSSDKLFNLEKKKKVIILMFFFFKILFA